MPGETIDSINGVPTQSINIYARLWQFETWLRTMVYVELRALLGDNWSNELKLNQNSWQADKSLTHMPTPEMNALSYCQLTNLLGLIDTHWNCFEGYFPPKPLWDAKLQEITQIRHRAAHFRVGHADDIARVKQFLRDIDKGFWQFCTSYNDTNPILPQSRDPVTAHFLRLDPLPWVEFEEKKWAQFGMRDKSLPVGLNVRAGRRPWATGPLAAGSPGGMYDFYLFAQDGRSFNIRDFLERTRLLHPQLIHLCLDNNTASLRLTLPTVLGADTIIELVDKFYEIAVNTVRPRSSATGATSMDALAGAWPEYVLGPENPLTFLAPEMNCSFFGV